MYETSRKLTADGRGEAITKITCYCIQYSYGALINLYHISNNKQQSESVSDISEYVTTPGLKPQVQITQRGMEIMHVSHTTHLFFTITQPNVS
jgi:hypothetical protein